MCPVGSAPMSQAAHNIIRALPGHGRLIPLIVTPGEAGGSNRWGFGWQRVVAGRDSRPPVIRRKPDADL
jgi:hypothetical protein